MQYKINPTRAGLAAGTPSFPQCPAPWAPTAAPNGPRFGGPLSLGGQSRIDSALIRTGEWLGSGVSLAIKIASYSGGVSHVALGAEIPEKYLYIVRDSISDYSVCTTWGVREKNVGHGLYILVIFSVVTSRSTVICVKRQKKKSSSCFLYECRWCLTSYTKR